LRRYHTDVIVVLLEHGADVFMDMKPFLFDTEKDRSLNPLPTTPLHFLRRKAPFEKRTFHRERTFHLDLFAILEKYEERAKKGMSERSDMPSCDSPQLEDLISFA
jgi:hypothetical protein